MPYVPQDVAAGAFNAVRSCNVVTDTGSYAIQTIDLQDAYLHVDASHWAHASERELMNALADKELSSPSLRMGR